MTATAAVAAPAGETEATADTLASISTPQAPSVIGVDLPEEAAVELDAITVTSEEAPEPVIEVAPAVVEDEAPVAAPVAQETAPAAQEEAPAQAAPVEQASAPAAQTTTQTTAQAAPQAAPEPAPAPVPSGNSSVVGIARQYVGAPYVYGGTTPAGWDCSGFTSYVFAQAGISLPRSSSAQRSAGTIVPASQAQPGDLVWWPGHVGIYTGNGMHIAARNPASGTYEGPVYGSPTYIRVG